MYFFQQSILTVELHQIDMQQKIKICWQLLEEKLCYMRNISNTKKTELTACVILPVDYCNLSRFIAYSAVCPVHLLSQIINYFWNTKSPTSSDTEKPYV